MTTELPRIGWRLWRLEDGRLRSWVVDHVWESGTNEARCLAPPTVRWYLSPSLFAHSDQPPGHGCRCGFWALWDLGRAVTKARREARDELTTVIGLMAGWGTVAIHGSEGFRAQRGRALFLLRDSVWSRDLDGFIWWPLRNLYAWAHGRGQEERLAEREAQLRHAAAAYGVYQLPLVEAIRSGVLSELGVPTQQIKRLESRLH
jgi:hypothetical protein